MPLFLCVVSSHSFPFSAGTLIGLSFFNVSLYEKNLSHFFFSLLCMIYRYLDLLEIDVGIYFFNSHISHGTENTIIIIKYQLQNLLSEYSIGKALAEIFGNAKCFRILKPFINVTSSMQIIGPAADMHPKVGACSIFIYFNQSNKKTEIGIETKLITLTTSQSEDRYRISQNCERQLNVKYSCTF